MTSITAFETLMFESKLDTFNPTTTINCIEDYLKVLSQTDNYLSTDGAHPLERTKSFGLHHDQRIKEVVSFIEMCCNTYWLDCGYDPNINRSITQMWAIKTKPGGFTPPHNHNPCIISGAFYVNVNSKSGGLHIENPLEFLLGKMPYPMTWGPSLRFNKVFTPEVGSIVLFPGWAKHFSEPNNSADYRYVLAFNYGIDESFSRNVNE